MTAAPASLPSSIDVSFEDDENDVRARTVVMDRGILAGARGASSLPPPTVPTVSWGPQPEYAWGSPESTQQPERYVLADKRRSRALIGVAVAFSFIAGIAAAFGTQTALTDRAAAPAMSKRAPSTVVASGVRLLEDSSASQKKAVSEKPKKKRKAKASANAAAAPSTDEAAEAPASDHDRAEVDPNGLLTDGIGE